LTDLGYLRTDGSLFELTPRSLEIGNSYLANLALPRIAERHLKSLAADLNETTALCILDGKDIVYIACVPSPRLLSVSISVGTRFPHGPPPWDASCWQALPETELESYLESVSLERLTQRTVGSPEKLREEIELARSRGWAMVSQELEDGLRGVAVPVRSGDKTLAAVNVSLQTHRAPADTIEKTVVPQLQDAARQIGQDYGGCRAS
jgi:IclR family pca regulon transcriptional regulator